MITWKPSTCECVYELLDGHTEHPVSFTPCKAHEGLSLSEANATCHADGKLMSDGLFKICDVLALPYEEADVNISWSFDEQRKLAYTAPANTKQSSDINTELAQISPDLTFTKI